MGPDAATAAQQRLDGDWSALEFAQDLVAESVETLTASLEKLEPLPRVRLLLAALLLPTARREELLEPLQVHPHWLRAGSVLVPALLEQAERAAGAPDPARAGRRCSGSPRTTGRSRCT